MKLLEQRLTLPTTDQTATLIGFGCVHEEGDGHVRELWEECVEQIASMPLCWAIGLGDYRNFARTTYRRHLRAYQADEDSQRDLDNLVKTQVHTFYEKYLKRIKKRLLGLAEGNHGWAFLDGTTDTQLLCQLAGVPYLEKGSFHRLIFRTQSGHTIRKLKLLAHHGDWGSGALTSGGDINALEKRAEGFDADIVMCSHTHRKFGHIVPVVTITDHGRLKLIERPRAYIRSGCFIRGYVEGCITYAERKLMRPTDLGYVVLRIEFFRGYDRTKYAEKKAETGSVRAARGAGTSFTKYRFKMETTSGWGL